MKAMISAAEPPRRDTLTLSRPAPCCAEVNKN
jgi:hypothetical protein